MSQTDEQWKANTTVSLRAVTSAVDEIKDTVKTMNSVVQDHAAYVTKQFHELKLAALQEQLVLQKAMVVQESAIHDKVKREFATKEEIQPMQQVFWWATRVIIGVLVVGGITAAAVYIK